jgi:hypothetical protein
MDYEVFLLSQVREEYLRRRDNDAAVVEGIAATARVIPSAALRPAGNHGAGHRWQAGRRVLLRVYLPVRCLVGAGCATR